MDEVIKDDRFSHIAHDPRFRRIPKREKKVKIDKRFQSMFTDKNFKLTYTVDKRGRPITHTSSEDLKKYYALSSSEEEEDNDDDDDDKDNKYALGKGDNTEEVDSSCDDKADSESESEAVDNRESSTEKNKAVKHSPAKIDSLDKRKVKGEKGELTLMKEKKSKEKTTQLFKKKVSSKKRQDDSCTSKHSTSEESSDDSSDEQEVLADNVKEKLRDLKVDYARGEGVLFSDSSSEEETSASDTEDEELDHGWGELDRDAEQTDEITNRLAVCHMDWDRIRANDLMVLFNSFLPQGGVIHSITIYPSEFGLERMKEEEVKGPVELVDEGTIVENGQEEDDGEENEEGSKYHMEKLRQYQLNRLKYYYAILVCDSPATANKIYTECDGLEYESSATRLDLRFVPDETTFDQESREVCDKLPDLSKYQPRCFTTTALQQAKVELTWDETNPERSEITQKLMSGQIDGITEADLRDYLASSSGEESDEAVNEEVEEKIEGGDDPVSKYRALLQGIEQQEEKKKFRDVEMEVSWGLGLKDKTEELVKKKLKDKKHSLTPFEQYLEKRKEKKKQKKEERKKKLEQTSETSDNAFSDDDIPSDIDMNDEYFKEEFQGEFKKKANKKTKKVDAAEGNDDKQEMAELELLLMNNDSDEKKHFSLKSIQEQETESKKKKKGKKKPITEECKKDDFEINVKDERFSALFSSHHFNIDPTDPRYRKTKAMEALRAEKLRRRQNEISDNSDKLPAKMQKLETMQNKDPELSLLVKAIKRKTQSSRKGVR